MGKAKNVYNGTGAIITLYPHSPLRRGVWVMEGSSVTYYPDTKLTSYFEMGNGNERSPIMRHSIPSLPDGGWYDIYIVTLEFKLAVARAAMSTSENVVEQGGNKLAAMLYDRFYVVSGEVMMEDRQVGWRFLNN